jgi:lysophospholipase L1-like esterase
MKLRLTLVVLLAQFAAYAQTKTDHWVATWGTAESLVRSGQNGPAGFKNQTVRMIARTSIGGERVRIKVENAFGASPVTIGAAHIALRGKDSEIVAGSDRTLMFNGKPGCILSPGVVRVSDPVDLNVAALTDLAVSIYFPGETGPPTNHGTGLHTTYISGEGDTSGQASMPDAKTSEAYYYLAAVDVAAPSDAAAIVTFGDSITDGSVSTPNTDHSWPALLAARLAKNKATGRIGVANMGISGNRVLYDGAGASALARFDRDVLSQSGVKWVMLLEGINDIGRVGATPPSPEAPAADDLIAAYRQFIDIAHTHGLKAIGCTLTPYVGAKYATEAGEAVREAVNTFIRTGGAFDAVVDFDAATRDSANPKSFSAIADSGDHLHPKNAGYEVMANAVDLAIFTRK